MREPTVRGAEADDGVACEGDDGQKSEEPACWKDEVAEILDGWKDEVAEVLDGWEEDGTEDLDGWKEDVADGREESMPLFILRRSHGRSTSLSAFLRELYTVCSLSR